MTEMSLDEASFSSPPEPKFCGTSLKRKRIEFVPAGSDTESFSRQNQRLDSTLGDRYLSIVLPDRGPVKRLPDDFSRDVANPTYSGDHSACGLCDICSLPLETPGGASLDNSLRPHEATLAHQVCLQHSYPPSHLDRTRQGLKYLSSYGWDPDGRLGLGVAGEGIRVPVKAKVKNNTVGLGATISKGRPAPEAKKERLNAKQAREKDLTDRKKREQLQEMFHQSEHVQRYLGAL